MLAYGDLKKGVVFVFEGQPWLVLDSGFLRMQQRKAVMKTRIKNLINGKVVDRNWQASDEFEEADIERKDLVFLYSARDEYWFAEAGNPKNRFALSADVLGDQAKFAKPNTPVVGILFNDKPIQIQLPIKMDFTVTEVAPAIKGSTAQGGNKPAKIDTGATVLVPMFVNNGDVIRVNTELGEYVERVQQ